MRLVGALSFGICAFFAAGLATGRAPNLSFRRKNRPEISKQQVWLTQAGLEITVLQWYACLAGAGLLAFGIVSALTATPVVALVPAIIAMVVPHAFFSHRRTKNLARTQQTWPDAIREVIAHIESNASLQGALVQLSQTGPAPLRAAFDRFPMLSTTLGFVPALEAVRERLSDPTSDRVIEVLILAHERGGGIITDILRDLATATTEDLQLQDEIESSQLEQKINARAVFVLPWVVLILLVATNRDFATFYRSASGLLVVIIGAFISLAGMLLVARISKDTPEPRVFGGSATPGSDNK